MHTLVHRAVIILALLVWTVPAVGQDPATLRQIEAELTSLPWAMGPAVQAVPGASATYRQSRDERWLAGENAVRAMTLLTGSDQWQDDTAVALDIYNQTQIVIEHYDVGHVDDADWLELDTAGVLEKAQETLENANEERRRQHYPTGDLAGFALEPEYYEEENAVYWAMRYLSSNGSYYVTGNVLKLSRSGLTHLVWAGPVSRFQGRRTLEAAMAPFRYDDGARYADFMEGDEVAGFGLAAAATTLASGRGLRSLDRVGAVLGFLFVAFKFFCLAVLAPIYFFRRLIFDRRRYA